MADASLLSGAGATANTTSSSEDFVELAAAAASAWHRTAAGSAYAGLAIELVLLLALALAHKARELRVVGRPYLATITFGCAAASGATLIDSLQAASPDLASSYCRMRNLLLYASIGCLLFSRLAVLVTACRRSNVYRSRFTDTPWDGRSTQALLALLGAQGLLLGVWYSATSSDAVDASRIFSSCTDAAAETGFHVLEVVLLELAFVGGLAMLRYLRGGARASTPSNAFFKEHFLSLFSLAFTMTLLFFLSTTSVVDTTWTLALFPVRLLLLNTLVVQNLTTLVAPPICIVALRAASRYTHGPKDVGEELDAKLRTQQAQLVAGEAQVAELQRALQSTFLQIKLHTAPMKQDYISVAALPTAGGGRSAAAAPALEWSRVYAQLFRNKKLVCWSDAAAVRSGTAPTQIIDLFEVKEVRLANAAPKAVSCASSSEGSARHSRASPISARKLGDGGQQQHPVVIPGEPGQIDLLKGRNKPGLRLDVGTSQSAVARGLASGSGRGTSASTTFPAARRRMREWHEALQQLLREVNEPVPPPCFQSLRVWVGTWNMGNAAPPSAEHMAQWLGVGNGTQIYAVGVQEASFSTRGAPALRFPSNTALTPAALILGVLLEALGSEYRCVETKSMWALRLYIFTHEEVAPHVEILDSGAEACGIGGVGGNKGGVAVALSIHRTTMCFINAHLAAHQAMVRRRNRDATDVLRGLRSLASSKQPGTKHLDPSSCFHHTFFFGDLNYRIEAPVSAVLRCIEEQKGGWERLHALDQLSFERESGRVLAGFQETMPQFAPTFKRLRGGGDANDGGGGGVGGFEVDEREESSAANENRGSRQGGGASCGGSASQPSKVEESDDDDDIEAINTMEPADGSESVRVSELRRARMSEMAQAKQALRAGQRPLPSASRPLRRAVTHGPLSFARGGRSPASSGGSDTVAPDAGLPDEDMELSQMEALADRLRYRTNRVPSWCDRILWRSFPACECELVEYRSEPQLITSDHTPVCASFDVRVMLPLELSHAGATHEWEFVASNLEVSLPFACLDDDDAIAAMRAPPELMVEIWGAFVRTGYTSPPLIARVGPGEELDGGDRLNACWNSPMLLPVTEQCQKFGTERLQVEHLTLQVVALFGSRRVTLGAAVLCVADAVGSAQTAYCSELVHCGVATGGAISLNIRLQDLAARHQEEASEPTPELFRGRSSLFPRGVSRRLSLTPAAAGGGEEPRRNLLVPRVEEEDHELRAHNGIMNKLRRLKSKSAWLNRKRRPPPKSPWETGGTDDKTPRPCASALSNLPSASPSGSAKSVRIQMPTVNESKLDSTSF